VTDHKVSRTSDGLVLKQYRPIAGDLPAREWRALQLLHEYAPGLSPQPIAVDLDAIPQSVTMSVVPGDPLGDQPVAPSQLRAIMVALERLHTCIPEDVLAGVPLGAGPPREALGTIASRLAAQPRPGDSAVVTRAYDEALRWLAGPEANRLLTDEPEGAVLARVDHNLTNFLWDGDRIRLVDFEYAGRSDRCAELAELVEHVSARCTADAAWQWFLDELDLSRAEQRRLITLRRLFAIMWLRILLPGQEGDLRNPPGTLQMQADRTLALLNSDA
jgi:aminoglycoside phosphotransferase